VSGKGNSVSLIPSFTSSVDRNIIRLAVLRSLNSLQLPYSLKQSLYGEWFVKHCFIDGICGGVKQQQMVHMVITSSPLSSSSSSYHHPVLNIPVHLYYFYDAILSILLEFVQMPSALGHPLHTSSLYETCIELLSKLELV
jgi:hypothetical protein